jgi:hypothetical protein
MKAFVPSQTKGVSPATQGRATQTATRKPKLAATPSRAHHSGLSTDVTKRFGMRVTFLRTVAMRCRFATREKSTASCTRYDGMFHGFASFADLLDDGRRGLTEAAAALEAALSP